jgi:threonine/homoserine/homoserine lactone efflux protein
MTLELYLTYVLACVVIALIPGPNVTLIISNSITYGTRAGLINVAGIQAGLAILLIVTLAGLATLIAALGGWFDWLRFIGAAYLIWLGWNLLRTKVGSNVDQRPSSRSFFLQGFIAMISNPKVLMFLGAFLPQFIDETRSYVPQVTLLSLTFMAVTTVFDSLYAMLAGSARHFTMPQYQQMISRTSGLLMIGGGLWLALIRTR